MDLLYEETGYLSTYFTSQHEKGFTKLPYKLRRERFGNEEEGKKI